MRNLALHTLVDQLGADRKVSADEALQLRRSVFPDGVVTREEAEALISLAARVANTDEAWTQAFVETITDHVLQAGEHPGHVDEATASWLAARFGAEGPRETEVEALLKILERAESAPDYLSEFARRRVAGLLAGKPMGVAESELVRRCLFASAGSGRIAVTEAEARWLFELDAESSGRANCAEWTDLFVKAVLNHLMGRRAPAVLEASDMMARQNWLHSDSKGVAGMLGAVFSGGWKGYAAKVRRADVSERMEAYYEAANASAEHDARLTLEEIAWTVGMTKQDGKRTANEEALLAELRRLEQG
jgi:hypothetical protein